MFGRKEFRDAMDRLREKVFRTATPKTIDGHYINGASLVYLAQAYTKVSPPSSSDSPRKR